MSAGRWCIPVLLAVLAGCRGGGFTGAGHGRAHRPPAPRRVRPFDFGTPDIVLLITGGTNGKLEICNCSGPMPGGLARRSGLIRSYRAAFGNTFVLDTGDLFWIEPRAVVNPFVLKAYRQVGYDAVVLGDQEWAVASGRLAGWLAAEPTPALSSTIAPAPGESPVPLVRVVRRQWGPVKLAVLSDVRREAFLFMPRERLAGLRFSGPADLAGLAKRLRQDGFVVVVVAHGDEQCLEKTARDIPADLIVRGHTRRAEKKLLSVAGRPVVKVGSADWVAVVAIKVARGPAAANAGARLAAMEYRLELVDSRWPLDARLLQTYQAYAHAHMRRELDRERTGGLDYVPSAECGRCHEAAYRTWRAGRHARAYKTLLRAGRTGDPDCLMCHTTGFGTEKGFYTIKKTPRMAGVNCQNCHRFNVPEHQAEGFKFPKVDEDVCTTCHTPVTDPDFDFQARLPKARCPHSPAPSPQPAGPAAAPTK